MQTNDTKYIVVIPSQNHAVFLYQKLLEKDANVELISTPNKLYKGCSSSIQFNSSDTILVLDMIKECKIVFQSIYKIINNGITADYIKI